MKCNRSGILLSSLFLVSFAYYRVPWRDIDAQATTLRKQGLLDPFRVSATLPNNVSVDAVIVNRPLASATNNNSASSSASYEPSMVLPSRLPFIIHMYSSSTQPPPSSFRIANASQQFQQLGCLKHPPVMVNKAKGLHDQKNRAIKMEMKMRDGCGPLRRDWRYNPPLSPLAQSLLQHQFNCSLPIATFDMDYMSGIGAHAIEWSRAMCYAWEHNMRLRSYNPSWLWLDHTHCDSALANRSPWLCYFPKMELSCPTDDALLPAWKAPPPRPPRDWPLGVATNHTTNMTSTIHRHRPCESNRQEGFVAAYRAATIEYMFHNVSALVIQEAQRQIGVLFGPSGTPDDLITVHLRWGDKYAEMKLVSIDKYISAVMQLLQNRTKLESRKRFILDNGGGDDDMHKNLSSNVPNIFLATEDPVAATAFVQAAPTHWNIFTDLIVEELSPFRPPSTRSNCASLMAKNTLGRSGLVSMGSLLVGMEANDFVLSTGSSYDRIINALRTNILDPRCGNCTRVIDVQPGEWK